MKNIYLSALLALAFASSTFAAEKAKPMKAKTEVTAEQRKAMADFHQKMADCLRSDKPLKECHKMMRAEMPESCPMDHSMGHGHGHHSMMKDDDAD